MPPLHDAELADVGTHVREGVHQEHAHLGEVEETQTWYDTKQSVLVWDGKIHEKSCISTIQDP